jgi:hypothetical protein
MEVQRVTGHKTLAMLLRYTQMDVGHLVDRLDATEASRPTESAKRSVGPSGVLAIPEFEEAPRLPANVIPFTPRNRPS